MHVFQAKGRQPSVHCKKLGQQQTGSTKTRIIQLPYEPARSGVSATAAGARSPSKRATSPAAYATALLIESDLR